MMVNTGDDDDDGVIGSGDHDIDGNRGDDVIQFGENDDMWWRSKPFRSRFLPRPKSSLQSEQMFKIIINLFLI